MVQTTIGRALGLTVPEDLLRTNAPVDTPREVMTEVERGPRPDWSSLGPAMRRDVAPLATLAGAGALIDGAVVVLASHLSKSLGMSTSGLVGLVITASAVRLVAGVLVGPWCRRFGRWKVVAAGGVVAACVAPLLAVADSTTTAAMVVVGVALAGAPIATIHLSLLADAVGPRGRARVLAAHAGGALGARGVGAAVMAAVAAAAGWRVALLVPLLGVIPALLVARRADEGPPVAKLSTVAPRVARLRSRGPLIAVMGVAGYVTIGVPTVVRSAAVHHHFGTSSQQSLDVVALVIALAGLPAAAWIGDGTDDPARLAVGASGGLAVFGCAVALAALGGQWVTIGAALGVALAGLAVAVVLAGVMIVEIAPAPARVGALAIFSAFAVFWGVTGAVNGSAARSAWGPGGVLAFTGLIAVGAAALLFTSRAAVREDAVTAALEAVDRRRFEQEHRSQPAGLEVSHIGFSYGAQPVLFDVSLRVEEGEVVALLGTNGAGKSTLLRLIGGLDHPARGTIRLFGEDTTYLEAEQVLDLGVALLSGGRMTFPSLTVAENIRVGAQTRFKDAAAARRAEDEVYATFPALADHRGRRAGNLSGGQQQMLALGRILLLRPRMLLLDELTLGLAPMIVEQLLGTVRRLNDDGATVVLVEQSANLALSLATRAFFLERGALRFDGPAAELLTHDELLRPVFLG